MGKEVKPTGSDFNFQKILNMGLMDYVDYIVDVGDRAGKEHAIETKLNEMKSRWDNINFQFK